MIRNDSNRVMELDIYLPNEKLAFEYQGEHHYSDIYSLGNKWIQKQKDEEKRKLCAENDITLIEIPYWWDKQIPSLVSSIHKQRKDLIPNNIDGQSISTQPLKNIHSGFVFGFFLNINSNLFFNRFTIDAWI